MKDVLHFVGYIVNYLFMLSLCALSHNRSKYTLIYCTAHHRHIKDH